MPKRSGFTLVELLVVITILAILSVIGITAFSGVQKNARDSRRKGDLRSIKIALELYKQTNGRYPGTDWVLSAPGNNRWLPGLDFNYMPNGVPMDSINTGNNPKDDTNGYRYAYWSLACSSFADGQFFVLVAQLENKSDADRTGVKDYKYCDGNGLRTTHGWSDSSYVVTSL